jgi:hypothetical protein
MKHFKIIFIFLMTIVSFESYSQAFVKDTKVVALGVGLGSSLGSFNYSSQIPGLSIQYEQGVWEAGDVGIISLGGYLGYKSFSMTSAAGNFEATSKWNYTIVGARSAFHYHGIDNDKVDLFGGLMLSYNFLNYSYSDNTGLTNNSSGNLGNSAGFTIYVGGRYFFTDNFAGFAELGYGVSYLNLGLVLRLN